VEVTLAAGDLEAVFVTHAGMIGRSLRHRGAEILGQRGGLEAYVERGSSFGLPLLHPWANRLDARFEPGSPPLKLDENGLPIHGLLTAARGWEVLERSGRRLSARFDFSRAELLEVFPYPHRLTVGATLDAGGLEVVTTLEPTSDCAVPIAFGWHPYLTLPGAARTDWRIHLPVSSRARLDERGIPTGEMDEVEAEDGALGRRVFDDLFPGLTQPAAFAVWGGARRVELVFEEGYPVAQVFAPPDSEFICFEPMTAPTNALVSGRDLRRVGPGESFSARFRLTVADL
jgi:aldose 1-epimerase